MFFLNLHFTFITYDGRKSNRQRAKSYEQRAKINEQRSKSNEQRLKSNEQRAKSNEQRAMSKMLSLTSHSMICIKKIHTLSWGVSNFWE